ncbi:MAG: hypothetical protein AAFR81_14165 [Chloroflexota bacterium]
MVTQHATNNRHSPPVEAFTGTVRKIHNSRNVVKVVGSSGGGQWAEKAHDYTIQIELPENRSRSFYVTAKQFHTIPSRVDITLYYDPLDEQILSVEPPYHASNQELGE